MKTELQEKIFNDFPTLFRYKPKKGEPFLPIVFGLECGNGWFDLIYDLCKEITELDKEGKVLVHQVKEKFGGLRFYIGIGTDEVFDAIHKAEEKSYKICEACGKEGKTRGGGWIYTLCDECNRLKDEGKRIFG